MLEQLLSDLYFLFSAFFFFFTFLVEKSYINIILAPDLLFYVFLLGVLYFLYCYKRANIFKYGLLKLVWSKPSFHIHLQNIIFPNQESSFLLQLYCIPWMYSGFLFEFSVFHIFHLCSLSFISTINLYLTTHLFLCYSSSAFQENISS